MKFNLLRRVKLITTHVFETSLIFSEKHNLTSMHVSSRNKLSWVSKHIPIIPVLGRQAGGALQVRGLPGLHGKF